MPTDMRNYNPKLGELQLSTLARDIVLYGGSDLQGVMDAYNLSEDELNALLDEGSFLAGEIRRYKKQVENDPKSAIRLASNEVLSHAVPELHNLIHDHFTEGKDKVKAIELAARLADAMPKETKSGVSGTMVTINMGSGLNTPTVEPINPSIEHSAESV